MQALESDPLGETYSFGPDGGGEVRAHALVDVALTRRAERFPAALYASTASL